VHESSREYGSALIRKPCVGNCSPDSNNCSPAVTAA